VPRPELLTIGLFARASGLTASALRFYADSGLLRPASVDQASGYRYYASDQVERAVVIRRLREIDVPLERVAEILRSDGRDAARVVDEHVAALAERAHRARETAAAVKASLDPTRWSPPVAVTGSVFAAAVEQIITATTREPGLPVLNGVRVGVSADGVELTATDRYRLSTRTLAPARPHEADWSATVDADDLGAAMPWARRRHRLHLSTRPGSIRLAGDDETTRECRTLAGPFPDHRVLLASLPEVRTRVLVPRNALVHRLEHHRDQRVRLRVTDSAVAVGPGGTPDAPPIPATVTGPGIDVDFAITTLYPAISTAIGPDLMLDLAGPDQPVVVRSADNGDLTTLAMPVRPLTQEGP